MEQGPRQYELVVFGATGYTGRYTAEHVAACLPTDVKWAVAGRSEQKLRDLAAELQTLHPDRVQPAIEVAQNTKDDLAQLAKKTKVLITTVGPFNLYGTAAVEACAETGTHYVDCTGEIPWVHDMISKYHDRARQSGAIMIPQSGIESAPPDLMAWKLASIAREQLGASINEVVFSINDMNAMPSGGTLATLLSIFDTYSLDVMRKSSSPFYLCSSAPPKNPHVRSLAEKLTGVRSVRDLGTLTDSIQGGADAPIVYRSWELYNQSMPYGPSFRFSPYQRSRNALTAFLFHVVFNSAVALMALSPVRWLLKRFVYAPGQGPTREQAKSEYVEWRAVADIETDDPSAAKRAYGRMRWNGSLYQMTGALLAEAALIIARDEAYAHELAGGILTPATLGEKYLERMEIVGLQTEFKLLAQ